MLFKNAARTFGLLTLLLLSVQLQSIHAQMAPPTPTLPPVTIVNAACLNPDTDMTLYKWAYANGYLLCETVDGVTEGIALYKESPTGSGAFSLVKGAGGAFSPGDLVGYGVDSVTALALYNGVTPQNQ